MTDIVLIDDGESFCINGTRYVTSQYEDIKRSTGWIKSDLSIISSNFCKLGFHLYELKKVFMGSYLDDKGKSMERDTCMEYNFYDYVNEVFGLSRTTCNNFIRVCVVFSDSSCRVPHMCLDKKYQEYGFSQLVEMASMPYWELVHVKPSMSVREIRAIKNRFKNESTLSVSVDEECSDVHKTDVGSNVTKLVKASFKDVYRGFTKSDLEYDLLNCLTSSIKNVDKVQNIILLLEEYWLHHGL